MKKLKEVGSKLEGYTLNDVQNNVVETDPSATRLIVGNYIDEDGFYVSVINKAALKDKQNATSLDNLTKLLGF